MGLQKNRAIYQCCFENIIRNYTREAGVHELETPDRWVAQGQP